MKAFPFSHGIPEDSGYNMTTNNMTNTKLNTPCSCGSIDNPHTCFGYAPNTPDKRVEEIVEQYAQSAQDMYFLAGARVSVETWKNTKDFLRNALTQHHQDLIDEVETEIKEIKNFMAVASSPEFEMGYAMAIKDYEERVLTIIKSK